MPNMDKCNKQFGRRLHAIFDRYQNVIRWSVFGQKHNELFNVQKSLYGRKPTGVNYIVGSGSPNGGKEPSFSVMYVDPKTMLPVDIETWAFDLGYANKYDQPRWRRNHDFRTTYGLKDLSPSSFEDLAEKIISDEEVAKNVRNHMRMDVGDKNAPCNSSCRTDIYCQVTANNVDEWAYCKSEPNTNALMSIENFFDHHWFKQK